MTWASLEAQRMMLEQGASRMKCVYGAHLFPTVRGTLERGSVCLCGALRAEFRYAGVDLPLLMVPFDRAQSTSRFTWLGDKA